MLRQTAKPCPVHGDEDPSSAIVVHCTERRGLASCDVDILPTSGWMRHSGG